MTAQEQLGLGELLARVKAAKGADRELDAQIAKHAAGLNFGWCNGDDWTCGARDCPGCGEPLGMSDDRHSYPSDWRDDERLPTYTSSIDVALALTERMLPGALIEIRTGGKFHHCYIDGETSPDFEEEFQAENMPTAPLAIIQALLTALLNTKENGE